LLLPTFGVTNWYALLEEEEVPPPQADSPQAMAKADINRMFIFSQREIIDSTKNVLIGDFQLFRLIASVRAHEKSLHGAIWVIAHQSHTYGRNKVFSWRTSRKCRGRDPA
jgi:hypothetical protein